MTVAEIVRPDWAVAPSNGIGFKKNEERESERERERKKICIIGWTRKVSNPEMIIRASVVTIIVVCT